MKLISVLVLMLGVFSTGCVSKTARGTASVTTKGVSDYADYTMANMVSVNRMPAGTGGVELSNAADTVSITLDVWNAYGENSQHADLTLTVRNQPAIAGKMSGNSRGSQYSRQFAAIMTDVRQNGWRPAAVPVVKNMQSKFVGLSGYPADQHAELIRAALLEGRDQLFTVYADINSAVK